MSCTLYVAILTNIGDYTLPLHQHKLNGLSIHCNFKYYSIAPHPNKHLVWFTMKLNSI